MATLGERLNGHDAPSTPRPPTPLNFNLLNSLQAQVAGEERAGSELQQDTSPSPPSSQSQPKYKFTLTPDSPPRKHDSAVERSDSTARFESYAGSRNSLLPSSPVLVAGQAPAELPVEGEPSSPPLPRASVSPPSSPPVVRRQASRGTLAHSIRESPSLRRLSNITSVSRSGNANKDSKRGEASSKSWKRLRRKSGTSQGEAGDSSSAPPVPPVQRVNSFYGISMDIPNASLKGLREDDGLEFSNRGSVLIDGEKLAKVEALIPREGGAKSEAVPPQHTTAPRTITEAHAQQLPAADQAQASTEAHAAPMPPAQSPTTNGHVPSHRKGLQSGRRTPSVQMLRSAIEQGRVLSAEEMSFSMRIRSMYDHGDEKAADWDIPAMPAVRTVLSNHDDDDESEAESDLLSDLASDVNGPSSTISVAKRRAKQSSGLLRPSSRLGRSVSHTDSSIIRASTEVAGGMEDYEEISGRDVDRYGFIRPSTAKSGLSVRSNGSHLVESEPRPAIQRVTTSLALISDAPRRTRSRRGAKSTAAVKTAAFAPRTSKDAQSLRTQGSLFSVRSGGSSLRSASNGRAISGRSRKLLDKASDMLTLPPGLEDIAEQEDGGRTAGSVKEREWAREEKWRKMAIIRATSKGEKRRSASSAMRASVDGARPARVGGGGMRFDFDTLDARVVSRTWKGIPDRWRATAWHSYLGASRRRRGDAGASDEDLIAEFHALQAQNCADDVQIDVDVPRTIGMHVMFRRRYRGGQRLLFRVLHAVALKFPDIGYVQGMASLATTLLCYFDEEMSFVMMVRLWELRGLKELFASGFGGLMAALAQFEGCWLARSDVAAKLEELGIGGTAYGTRWYLTLFNMSIPFPAQLRVWDVFMLLGDAEAPASKLQKPAASVNGTVATPSTTRADVARGDFGGADLDVLHATSAALIDATREILLDSDFENAMKVLTSWIPVKDEDLLMRVAKAEYKAKKRRD